MSDGWSVAMRQLAGGVIGLEYGLPEHVADPAGWRVRLFGFPVSFNGVGAAEGRTVDFGARPAAPPALFTIPDSIWYGAVTLVAVLEPPSGGAVTVSDAVGLVLRRPDKAYGVTLKREALGEDVHTFRNLTGCRLRVQAVESVGIPRALFLHRKTYDGLGRLGNEFLAVCRPPDFAEYPENEPPGGSGKYRLPHVDVVMHTSYELERFWEALQGDVRRLVATMEANRRLESAEVVVL